MTSIFEGQPPKTRPFPIKTRVIWVPGIYNNIICIKTWVFFTVYIYIYTHTVIYNVEYFWPLQFLRFVISVHVGVRSFKWDFWWSGNWDLPLHIYMVTVTPSTQPWCFFQWCCSPTSLKRFIWANYNDLSRGHLKLWFSKGIPPKSSKIPLIQV